MPPKKKGSVRIRPPFGVAVKRFNSIGIHPNLDKTGGGRKSVLGPGEYNPQRFECAYKKCIGGSSWKRKAEVEEFSKNLGYRNAYVLKEREFWKSCGGPGNYEIQEKLFKQDVPPALPGSGFGRQKRFQSHQKMSNPPIGTYGKDITTAPIITKRQFTNLPPFEWDGFIDRFKSNAPTWTKPPNLYNPKDPGSINGLLNKVVSKRGPYDCFTGPRDDTTIKNKFSPPTFKGPLNFFHTFPTELDILLTHPQKQRCGCFFKDKRFRSVGRDPNEPGPFTYDVLKSSVIKESKYSFNSSVKEARPPTKWAIHPGVGRYTVKDPTCARTKRPSWVFKSIAKRTEYKAVEYNAF